MVGSSLMAEAWRIAPRTTAGRVSGRSVDHAGADGAIEGRFPAHAEEVPQAAVEYILD